MSKMKVFVTRPDVPISAMKLLTEKYDVECWQSPVPMPRRELLNKIRGFQGLYCFSQNLIDEELLQAAGSELKVIGTFSAGYDHININECKKRGILVGYTPDVLTAAVAELTVGLLLATSRRFLEANHEITNGGWANSGGNPLYCCGTQVKGSIIGIVGLGRIGLAIAKRLVGFEVEKILYTGRNPHPKAASEVGAEFVSFDQLLTQSDFVVISCALTPDTKEMFDKNAFEKMKPNSILINSSRGAVVKQDDLCNALKTGKIKAAGLDVMTPEPLPIDHPLTKLSNCVLLPHIGSATEATRIEMAMLTSRNIIAGLEGQELPARLC